MAGRIERSLAFLECYTRPAVDYGRDLVVVAGVDAAPAEQTVTFINTHGWEATAKGGRVLIPFGDKRFGSLTFLNDRIIPDYGQGKPRLVARVTFGIKKEYQQGPRAVEVIKWADDMERQFPSLSIHTNAQHGLTIEQTLSFNEVMTWSELSTSIGSFRDTIMPLAQGPGLNGFRKYLSGFANLVPLLL